MPGIFSVPREGLHNVSVDELLAHAEATQVPARPQEEIDEDVAEEALAYLRQLELPALFTFKGADGQPLLIGRGRAWQRLKALVDRLPDGRERRMVIHKLRRHMAAKSAATRQQRNKTDDQIKLLRVIESGALDLVAWEKRPCKLEKPAGTIIHKFRDALARDEVFDFRELQARLATEDRIGWAELAAQAQVFVIEHNWAAAFVGADEYAMGREVHLPAECCAFEFRISGRSVIAFATETDGTTFLQHAIQSENGCWLVGDMEPHAIDGSLLLRPGTFSHLTAHSIHAVAVALEAQVAETTVIRAPHKLNAARERRGKLPIASYHVVSLANRSRVARLERDGQPPSHHKRLHFRRGHWRHFETFKTWIRWTLVGDPDLGFVDKHYRL